MTARKENHVPDYEQLRARTDAPAGSSWGLFERSPERGMANFAQAAQVAAAAGLVRRGTVVNLDYPLDAFDPSVVWRTPPEQTITSSHADQRDDYVDHLWLQASSHVDGLRHRRHHEAGFYGGVPDSAVAAGTPALGVQRWAEEPIVGRGVLVDLARFREAHGSPIDHAGGEPLPLDLVEQTLAHQGVTLQEGDLLLLRTGWAEWYLSSLDDAGRAAVAKTRRCTGLAQSRELIAWIWDHRLALLASDTFALEAMPPPPDPRFGGPHEPGMVHQDLIGLLGLPIGEQWKLDTLSATAAEVGGYTFLVVVKPLNLVGGVGSPANAVALC
ncbi:cyclase family protein [Amycolatopsis rhabdoformis]|uniref:Cyclase family protein n=1 Tax=Amycolatopsis rhabdoformis TaxID=1448059 RepID=A0ABZ1IB88_9PSEU|nr:cyclase family protein [Amycolatopsis rhabdoformis]WSE31393.1 cyclase family protein [Amycolatopsis rhabdoformis]